DSDPNTKYAADGSALRLRRFSSTSTIAYVDFPDGSSQQFIKNSHGHWDLHEIDAPRGSAKVTVSKLSTRPGQCAFNTDSWWSVADGTRTHYLCYKNYSMDWADKPMIDSVVLDGPQNQQSIYRFAYSTYDVVPSQGEPAPWQNPCGFGRTSP